MPRLRSCYSFTSKRTGKAKIMGVATLGVAAVVMPKRLKCNGCGTNLKRGDAPGQVNVEAPLPENPAPENPAL